MFLNSLQPDNHMFTFSRRFETTDLFSGVDIVIVDLLCWTRSLLRVECCPWSRLWCSPGSPCCSWRARGTIRTWRRGRWSWGRPWGRWGWRWRPPARCPPPSPSSPGTGFCTRPSCWLPNTSTHIFGRVLWVPLHHFLANLSLNLDQFKFWGRTLERHFNSFFHLSTKWGWIPLQFVCLFWSLSPLDLFVWWKFDYSFALENFRDPACRAVVPLLFSGQPPPLHTFPLLLFLHSPDVQFGVQYNIYLIYILVYCISSMSEHLVVTIVFIT